MTKKSFINKIGKQITPFVSGKTFSTLSYSFNGIAEVLKENGINIDNFTLYNAMNKGRQVFEFETVLGPVFLSFIWERMDSGNWEVIAYIH